MAATRQAVRRWILTGAFTAITATGAIYGATLKEDVEVKKVRGLLLTLSISSRLRIALHYFHQAVTSSNIYGVYRQRSAS